MLFRGVLYSVACRSGRQDKLISITILCAHYVCTREGTCRAVIHDESSDLLTAILSSRGT